MAPSPSPETGTVLLDPTAVELLLDLADATIRRGLHGRDPVLPDVSVLPVALRQRAAAFVTLHVAGELNGCIGSIDGAEPLGQAVAELAWSAAFSDPRLPALRHADYADLTIELSVLSPLEPLPASSRAELVADLRIGIDGLLIAAGTRRGVFLPAVWDQIADPDDFLDHLFTKAGLSPRRWPADLEAHRFTVHKYSR